ncbi:DUF2586 domain-containing protein [Edaphovirga cremea]|uniref:DUF2586 domain-containing protein n=1 Tax=Edaphovirga cremea TaxID=2267246 RepID=UPI00398974A4
MTWPNVTINQLNRLQGRIAEIERTLLYVGRAVSGDGDLITLNSQSDIDTVLEDADELLRENVRTAQLNGGQNWQAYALLIFDESTQEQWPAAIESAQDFISVEGVVVMTQIKDAAAGRTTIAAYAALRETLISKFGRRVWFILTVCGPNEIVPGVNWNSYLQLLSSLQTGIAASSVQLVPSLWGNEAGVLGGRLCNRSVTVADSPARVKTGPIVGLGIGSSDLPVDKDGAELTLAHLRAMHDARYSVPMWYPDYEGLYWSDGRTLDVNGGDYQIIENLRVADMIARRVRLMAIANIADRSMNSTPTSIAAHETYFAGPMREHSRSSQINGVTFPGEVKPPQDGDVTITWSDIETVAIYIVVRPYGSAKSITVGIMLDLTLEG